MNSNVRTVIQNTSRTLILDNGSLSTVPPVVGTANRSYFDNQ